MRIALAFGVVAACGLAGSPSGAAQGATGASGQLLAGGVARGDISSEAGDADTIGIDLDAGEKLSVRWSSGFKASVTLTDPSGAPVAIGLDGTTAGSVTSIPVATAGRHLFTIASSDGTQGRYTLTARGTWDKTVVLDGTGQASFDVPMPADSVVKGRVQPLPGAANPNILSLTAPGGAPLLANPVVGTPGLAKLPPIRCADAGAYRIGVSATGGTLAFRATLKRSVRREATTRIDLSNGLSGPSFANDGIGDYFRRTCAGCHSWAGSYATVRFAAIQSLGRMRSGNMPPGGPRTSKTMLTLIDAWTRTGYGR